MQDIQILPETVINQIAAGEVVERPASAIKELLENSLDANATQIEVTFRQGGKQFLSIQDNGTGMSPENAILALQRHATSKITNTEDLSSLISFGFRGEALPSISSISRFTLRTRTAKAQCGTEIYMQHGKLIHEKECGMRQGTYIEASHIFETLPARKKFLKTDNTEAGHIIELIKLYATAYPHCQFTLKEGNKTILHSPSCPNLKERITEIWGKACIQDLFKIQASLPSCNIHGFISKNASQGKATRNDMRVFVNNRPIVNKAIFYAIKEAYQGALPNKRFPITFLFLDIDPSKIDVNAHPTKQEIRFQNEGQIQNQILEALIESLQANQDILKPIVATVPFTPARMELNEPALDKPAPLKPIIRARAHIKLIDTPKIIAAAPNPKETDIDPPLKQTKLDWKFLSRFDKHYALFQDSGQIVILNCRAAHERICFEKLQNNWEGTQQAKQALTIAEVITCSLLEAETLNSNLEMLSSLGFEIEAFGKQSFKCTCVPAWLTACDIAQVIIDIIHTIQESGKGADNSGIKERIARIASAQAAQKQDLSEASIRNIAQELFNCKRPMTCPKGRPTIHSISASNLDTLFSKKISSSPERSLVELM